jgi:U-box domain
MKSKQEKKEYSEEQIFKILKKILIERKEPMLVMKLGHALQFETEDTGISIFLREKFGGLPFFLRKHADTFLVTGISPKFIVSLRAAQLQHPISVPLTEEMMLITRYKTIPCQHFVNNMQCPHQQCNFSHGGKEHRRNPLSPFFESYGPTLVEGDRDPLGRASTNCINQLEFFYHPENYRTEFCKTTAARTSCKERPVCCHAHNFNELRLKYSEVNSLAYLARYQKWGRLIVKLFTEERPQNFTTMILTEVYSFSEETFLHYAAKYGQSLILQVVNSNFKLDPTIWATRDIFGQTMLMKACAFPGTNENGQLSEEYIETIKFLIQANKDAALFKDYEGHDIFYFAKKQIRSISVRDSLCRLLKTTLEEAGMQPKIAEIDDSPDSELIGYSIENAQAPALPANSSETATTSAASSVNPSAFFKPPVSNPVKTVNQASNSSVNQIPEPQLEPAAPCERVSISLNPENFCCPITFELFKDPVRLLYSGSTYERSAIVKSLLKNPICPLTQKNIPIKAIRPNPGYKEDDIVLWGKQLQDEGVISPDPFLREICEEIRKAEAAQMEVAKQNTAILRAATI